MTTVEVYGHARVPGSKLAEVDLVLRATATDGIRALRRAYFRGDVLDFEATWDEPAYVAIMPRMRVVGCVVRGNGNVWFRMQEVP